MNRFATFASIASCLAVAACGGDGESSDEGSACGTDGTFGLVERIFEDRGCLNSACHGQDAESAGGLLDLRADVAYESLVNARAMSGDYSRVFPGDEEISLLYLKLAAKTEGFALAPFNISGSPMPSTGEALTGEELSLVRAWIRAGAPEVGFVEGGQTLADCDASSVHVVPNKIPPLPPPSPDEGVQIYSGGYLLGAEAEDEVCFATYYDFSDRIPASKTLACPEVYGGPTRVCFAYEEVLIAQDPQSHHAVIDTYIPPADKPEQYDPRSDSWKNWVCLGGERDGEPCDPIDGCGERSACATKPETAVACVGYPNGPPEMATVDGFFGNAASRRNIAFAQEPTFREDFVDGVYGVLPVQGFTVWNSHAFNLTPFPTNLEQYMNFRFADEESRLYQREELIIFDAIFAMGRVEPFASKEVCATFSVPQGTRMITLSSHTHKRGRDFRIWYPSNESCVAGPSCLPPARDPDYRSFVYDDPVNFRFGEDNELAFDSDDEDARRFRYCAIFDNGAEEPASVRRDSTGTDQAACAFADASGGFITACGCEPEDRACLGGPDQGTLCGGDHTMCGGAGICDACPLGGGITTEEEMFAVVGSFFVIPVEDRRAEPARILVNPGAW